MGAIGEEGQKVEGRWLCVAAVAVVSIVADVVVDVLCRVIWGVLCDVVGIDGGLKSLVMGGRRFVFSGLVMLVLEADAGIVCWCCMVLLLVALDVCALDVRLLMILGVLAVVLLMMIVLAVVLLMMLIVLGLLMLLLLLFHCHWIGCCVRIRTLNIVSDWCALFFCGLVMLNFVTLALVVVCMPIVMILTAYMRLAIIVVTLEDWLRGRR